MPGLIHWLASRQFAYLDPSSPLAHPLGQPHSGGDDDADAEEAANFVLPRRLADLTLPDNVRLVACNGRCNKVADSCYTWWVSAALANLGHKDLVDWPSWRRFLLERMAHRIGGFSKHSGDPPDVYHSCFGLTALGVMGEPGLNEVDSALAVPVRTVRVIEKARAALLEGRMGEDGKGARGLMTEAVEMGVAMRGVKPAWLAAVGA